MSLRQREWAIFIRPYDERLIGGVNVRVPYVGTPKAMEIADLGYTRSGIDIGRPLKGDKVGEVPHVECDSGGWVMYSRTTSFTELREVFKILLDEYGKDYTRVVEVLPLDSLVTPLT